MQPEPKVSYSSFYQRVRKWLSREEAIQNITMYVPKRKQELRDYWNNYEWEKVWYTRFLEVYTWCWNKERAIRKNWITIYERYPKEYSIYQTYKEPKASFSLFVDRLKKWKSIEQALIPTRWARGWWWHIQYESHADAKEKLHKDDNYYIEVSYSKEEAEVFRKVYKKMIDDLEYERLDATPQRSHEIEKEIKKLELQLEIFNIYNPTWP